MSDEILVAVADGVATVTLNRPDKRNAMNAALLRALPAAFDDLDARTDVRVVVVRGAGPAFSSGRDLREMESRAGGEPEVEIVPVLKKVEGSRWPTLAVIHGDAIAGGCELALHCDLRIAADGARLGMPLARIGLVPGFALGQKLVEIIGPAHTRHLLLTGRPIDAARALEIGLVEDVAAPADLDSTLETYLDALVAGGPDAVNAAKRLVRDVAGRPPISVRDLTVERIAGARVTAEGQEGMRAFLERRRPEWR